MMNRRQFGSSVLLFGFTCALILALNVGGAVAQGEGYSLSWWTADSGGVTTLVGGDYVLAATAGQADAASAAAGAYALTGGFWSAGPAATGDYELFLPLLLQNL